VTSVSVPRLQLLLLPQLQQKHRFLQEHDCDFRPQRFGILVRFQLHLGVQPVFACEQHPLDVLHQVGNQALPELAHSISGPTCGLDLATPHQTVGVDDGSRDSCQERAHGSSGVGFWVEKDHDRARHLLKKARRWSDVVVVKLLALALQLEHQTSAGDA
jgi:hypothetical protein